MNWGLEESMTNTFSKIDVYSLKHHSSSSRSLRLLMKWWKAEVFSLNLWLRWHFLDFIPAKQKPHLIVNWKPRSADSTSLEWGTALMLALCGSDWTSLMSRASLICTYTMQSDFTLHIHWLKYYFHNVHHMLECLSFSLYIIQRLVLNIFIDWLLSKIWFC